MHPTQQCLCGWLLVELVGLGRAELLYVATDGVDDIGCGSTYAPCGTINWTATFVAREGDTVHVREGVYAEQEIDLRTPVHIRGDPRATMHCRGDGLRCVRINGIGVFRFSDIHFEVCGVSPGGWRCGDDIRICHRAVAWRWLQGTTATAAGMAATSLDQQVCEPSVAWAE